ncbi:hypothetical protein PtB15_1B66 [Puccinia triticina]|nr:hypothetical protein PtB15_1B66 [Puccinia triticina]
MAPQTPEPTTTNPQTAPQALLPTGLAPARSDLDLATQSPRGPSTCVSNPGTDQSRLPSDSPPTNKELSPNVGTTCSQDEVVPSHEDNAAAKRAAKSSAQQPVRQSKRLKKEEPKEDAEDLPDTKDLQQFLRPSTAKPLEQSATHDQKDCDDQSDDEISSGFPSDHSSKLPSDAEEAMKDYEKAKELEAALLL